MSVDEETTTIKVSVAKIAGWYVAETEVEVPTRLVLENEKGKSLGWTTDLVREYLENHTGDINNGDLSWDYEDDCGDLAVGEWSVA